MSHRNSGSKGGWPGFTFLPRASVLRVGGFVPHGHKHSG